MKIILEIDEDQLAKTSGPDAGKLLISDFLRQPWWWATAASSIEVSGSFGKRIHENG